MLLDKKISDLQNLTKRKITYDDIAKVFNISRSAVQNRISRKQPLKGWEEEKLDEFFLSEMQIPPKASIRAEYFPDSFGSFQNGRFVLSQNKEIIYIPAECFTAPFENSEIYYVIRASGSSMQPSIYDGDRLIIRLFKDIEQISDNKIYVFAYENQIFIKRLIKNINRLIIISDNKDQCGLEPVILQNTELNKVHIIAETSGIIRSC